MSLDEELRYWTPFSVRIASGDGAINNKQLGPTVAANQRLAIQDLMVTTDNTNTVDVALTIGFGTANTPSPALAGTNGILFNEGAMPKGSRFGGIFGKGGKGEELRSTNSAPTTGGIDITFNFRLYPAP